MTDLPTNPVPPAHLSSIAETLGAQLHLGAHGWEFIVAPSAATAPWRTPVGELAVIRASGDDAASFLQGQLSTDVEALAVGRCRFAAYCSAKGRMLASFIVLKVAPDSFTLVLSRDIVESVHRRLKMFVLRAKVNIESLADDILPIAVLAPPDSALIQLDEPLSSSKDGVMLRLPDITINGIALARELHLVAAKDWLASWESLSDATPVDSSAYRATEILAAEARIVAATVERFVPQMVNFELIGGVDFTKGCFPGQEVIARSQNLGRMKRRMMLAMSDKPVVPGDDIVANGAPVGIVVSVAPGDAVGHPAKMLCLVETAAELVRAGNEAALPAGLTGLDLPYPMPEHKPFERPKL